MNDKPFADDKDWTWVLNELCPECEFEVRYFAIEDVAVMIRSIAADWSEVLRYDDALLRRRPQEDRWSGLEYAAHVRDVFELYDSRLGLMLNEDGPHYPNWDQDATAVEKDYGSSKPVEVAADLVANAEKLADRFESVSGDDWQRTGFRSDGAAFTIETFARYLVHDPAHHFRDVLNGFDKIRS